MMAAENNLGDAAKWPQECSLGTKKHGSHAIASPRNSGMQCRDIRRWRRPILANGVFRSNETEPHRPLFLVNRE